MQCIGLWSRLTRQGCPDRGMSAHRAPLAAPDPSEDTGFSTQPSGDQSGKLGHICAHMSLYQLRIGITNRLGWQKDGCLFTHYGMLSSHVLTEGRSSFPDSEGRRPGDRGAPYRALLLPHSSYRIRNRCH